MPNDLMKFVESVLAQKRALDEKERQFIASLNRALPDMGYRVVSTATNGSGAGTSVAPRRRGRPLRSTDRVAGSAPKNLVCAECGRRFSRPLHLGRHTSAMHKASATKPAQASPRKPGRGKRARTVSRAKPS
jgi:hypothetical protein